ncbi:aminotransferase class III-fold pyridoxal phosphate-dependent enzyme [Achromobacter spanius]|uniref:Diaminobutyrate--2-oxoglutarate transaminase n=1 Tax=Achromobacter spanius TaxID=217203 RepID=A0A2S0I5M7_9BURK|nr:aminotransferase class III-fold pyridoxal phosphate-dependent enzyme [Achromobacter spanius]AVJ27339.1 acetylornithine transaminase [Achromobacter spanius]
MTSAYDYLMATACRPSFFMVHGSGSRVTDSRQVSYLDFTQGRGVNSLGHCPPTVVNALIRQANTLIHAGSHFHYESTSSLAKELIECTCFDQAFFANSGTEAVESAIKLARKWGKCRKGGAHEIVTFHGGFHGRTFGSMAATNRTSWAENYGPLPPGFVQSRFNDIEALSKAINENTVAILLELVQGEGGVISATSEFLRAARTLCDDNGLLLIVDEVQTGMGRLGTLFGYELFGIEPDIIAIGKGLGGGLPISAILAKQQACVFENGDHGGTFNGGPLVTAAAYAVLRTVASQEFLEQVQQTGAYLGVQLGRLSVSLGLGDESGVGLLRRLDCGDQEATEIVQYARDGLPFSGLARWNKRGILLNAPKPNCLRFLPALTVSQPEIDEMVDGLRHSILAIRTQEHRQK